MINTKSAESHSRNRDLSCSLSELVRCPDTDRDEGRLNGTRITISFRVARSPIADFVYRPRRIVDYSIVSFFFFSPSRIPCRSAYARFAMRVRMHMCPVLIPAVHFPSTSNRIFVSVYSFPGRGEILRAPRDSRFSRRLFSQYPTFY